MHYGFPEIMAKRQTGTLLVTVDLGLDDTSVAPGTTKKVFTGPGTVTYLVWPEGGLDVKTTTAALLHRSMSVGSAL